MGWNVAAFIALLLGATGYGGLRGGQPERWMAAMFLAAAAASRLLYDPTATRFFSVAAYVAALDILLLGGITWLVVKADRFWPIAMFAVHGVTVLAHVVRIIDLHIIRKAYAIAVAGPAYVTLAILIVATARHRSRISRAGVDRVERDWSPL